MDKKKYPIAKSRYETLPREFTTKERDLLFLITRAKDYNTEQALRRLLRIERSKR